MRAAPRDACLTQYTLTVVALSLLVLLLPTQVAALGSAPGDIAARIAGLSGEADMFVVQRSESGRSLGRKWIPAIKDSSLHLKDRVRTRQEQLRLEFTDGEEARNIEPTIVNIQENTEVAIDDFNIDFENPGHSYSIINLIRGAIRDFLKGWGEHGFSVRAGVAVCSLRGSGEFDIYHDPEGQIVRVSVRAGNAVLTGPGGSRLIKAGESATMIGGAFPESPPT